jgi:hypothetical protein
MGGGSSKPTVLECMLKHFKKGFAGDYGIKMSPGRLRTLCKSEWPTFGVNWPPESTLDLPMVRAIYQIVIGNSGYPDQFPYIDSWLQVAQTMPSWIQFCANRKGQSRVFLAQAIKPKDQNVTKPNLFCKRIQKMSCQCPHCTFPEHPHHQSSQCHLSQTACHPQ